MLSVIVPTNESERILVRTLACLVPGATAGLIRDVILADAGSTDETAEIGDIAGCRFLSLPGPLGPRLDSAVTVGARRLADVPAGRRRSSMPAGWRRSSNSSSARPTNVAAAFSDAARPHGQDSLLAADARGLARAPLAASRPAGAC